MKNKDTKLKPHQSSLSAIIYTTFRCFCASIVAVLLFWSQAYAQLQPDASMATIHTGDANIGDIKNNDKRKEDASNPDVLTIAFATIEDNSLYEQIYSKFILHLRQCIRKPVLLYPVYDEKQILQSLQEGKLHLVSLGAGATMFAVNQGSAVPFASRGSKMTKQKEFYELWLITKKNAPYKQASDLKGKKIAHTTPTSNSGNLAPRVLFPGIGLDADKNYTVEFSGRHDKSILGVKNGFYDGAAIASDVFQRMVFNQQIQEDAFKVLWRSKPFPTNSFSHHIKLAPKLVQKIKKCFLEYEFPPQQAALLNYNTIFVPVNYKKDWDLVRKIYEQSQGK